MNWGSQKKKEGVSCNVYSLALLHEKYIEKYLTSVNFIWEL